MRHYKTLAKGEGTNPLHLSTLTNMRRSHLWGKDLPEPKLSIILILFSFIIYKGQQRKVTTIPHIYHF